MIKINLLTSERKAVKKRGAFLSGQKLTIGCSLILVATVVGIGWRYLTLAKESRGIDQEISDAQKETARLHSIIVQVQLPRLLVDHHVFEHGAEAMGRRKNLGLGLGRQPDGFRVAAAFEVEDASVAPAVLVVADQLAMRIGRERCLAGA